MTIEQLRAKKNEVDQRMEKLRRAEEERKRNRNAIELSLIGSLKEFSERKERKELKCAGYAVWITGDFPQYQCMVFSPTQQIADGRERSFLQAVHWAARIIDADWFYEVSRGNQINSETLTMEQLQAEHNELQRQIEAIELAEKERARRCDKIVAFLVENFQRTGEVLGAPYKGYLVQISGKFPDYAYFVYFAHGVELGRGKTQEFIEAVRAAAGILEEATQP